jgi:hypothetical protein
MNAFLDLADQQMSAPRKRTLRAAETRRANKLLDDRDRQTERWRRWNQDRVEALLARHADASRALLDFLRTMTLASAGDLIGIARSWRTADANTRFEVLSLIDTAIIELRQRHGLPPFDDALPGEPPTVFQIIREILK